MLDFNDRETTDYSDVNEYIKKTKRQEKEKYKHDLKVREKQTNEVKKIGSFSVNPKNVKKFKKILAILGVATTIAVTGHIVHKLNNKETPEVTLETVNPYDEFRAINYTVKYGDNLWNLARRALQPGASDSEIAEKMQEIKDINSSTWQSDYITEGDVLTISVSKPCLTKFGFILDESYQRISVTDQITDKMNYLNFIFKDFHKIIDTIPEEEIYAEDLSLYSELQDLYDELINNDLGEEERIIKEREFFEMFDWLVSDYKRLYKDNNEFSYDFIGSPHEPASKDLLDPLSQVNKSLPK